MTSFWENGSILWTDDIKQMDLVIKDDGGGRGHAHRRADHENFFPTKMRITMIQVAAGSTNDPARLPPAPKKQKRQAPIHSPLPRALLQSLTQ